MGLHKRCMGSESRIAVSEETITYAAQKKKEQQPYLYDNRFGPGGIN